MNTKNKIYPELKKSIKFTNKSSMKKKKLKPYFLF